MSPVETLLVKPSFPLHCLNSTQRQMAEAVAEVYQLPIEMAGMPVLATTAAACGKAFKLTRAVNGRENYANLYIVPGAGKSFGKGAAGQVASPMQEASALLKKDWVENERPRLEAQRCGLEARSKFLAECLGKRKNGKSALDEGQLAEMERQLYEAKAKLEALKLKADLPPTLHVGDSTSAALAERFARNGEALFAIANEGGDMLRAMLGRFEKGDQTDVDLYLAGYSVEPYESERIGRGTISIRPCLTALIFCQPILLSELYSNEEAFERGLTARMLPFICESPVSEDDGVERSISAAALAGWGDLIRRLLDKRRFATEPLIVQCSPDAREVFRAYHNESVRLRNGVCREYQDELGRWRENACRIALGLCVADDPGASVLAAEQAQRAVELGRWAQLSGLQVLHQARAGKLLSRAERLRSFVLEYGGKASFRDLEKSHGFNEAEIEGMVARFSDKFRIETVQNPNGGPRSRIIRCCQ